ncbi:MAG TPA: asparagine synthase (glutamine-hydrolyzing) [Gemmatimonadales bacterium]|nr:asparagine synthase (glutamine-hydrolyzing) [Gemmatimonadales bacterium]
MALWNRDGRPIDRAVLERAVRSQAHRGPDDEGYVLIDTLTGRFVQCRGVATDPRVQFPALAEAGDHPFDLALGHRRLSIVDLSTAGHQPMGSRDGKRWIVFNGMIHNYVELRDELRSLGHSFATGTDTEVILAAWEAWGPDCVQRFNGMWAFALWDATRSRLFASRDRLGIKPLLIGRGGATIVVASELKAIRQVHQVPADLDPEAVHHYLSLMKVPAPLTIFRAVRKVMPGHEVVIRREGEQARAWWRLEQASIRDLDEDTAEAEVTALLEESMRLRLIADVPIGALLSGGVDSSIVTSLAAGMLPPEALTTYTLSFPGESAVDETAWASLTASHLGVRHVPVRFTDDFLRELPRHLAMYDEPFAVSSALGISRIAEVAVETTRVVLTGDGGDELFAGYPSRHEEVDQKWDRLEQATLARFRGSRAEAAFPRSRWHKDTMAEQLRLRLLSIRLAPGPARDRGFNARRCLFQEPEKQSLYGRDWREATREFDTLHFLANAMPAEGGDRLSRWQLHDVRTSLHDEMLSKVDRATMGRGLEARPPLLDHRLVELALHLPRSLKVRDGTGKWILKRIGEHRVPPGLLHRKKQGFTIPLASLFKEQWRELIGDAFTPATIARTGVFDPPAVQAVLERQASHPNYITSHMVYSLLCFQVWHQQAITP